MDRENKLWRFWRNVSLDVRWYIIKIVATRCQILRLEYTKIDCCVYLQIFLRIYLAFEASICITILCISEMDFMLLQNLQSRIFRPSYYPCPAHCCTRIFAPHFTHCHARNPAGPYFTRCQQRSLLPYLIGLRNWLMRVMWPTSIITRHAQ